MRTIEIKTQVKDPKVIEIIKDAKAKKQAIHALLVSGVPISEIPEELKISLQK
ncbi:MAG: hypothetical protein J0L87_12850 [Bacteroidetes bacterium]|nr:hypothetical protein [Bacteroidota bacterium]